MILTDPLLGSEMRVLVNRCVHRHCSEDGVKNRREVPVHGHHISAGGREGSLTTHPCTVGFVGFCLYFTFVTWSALSCIY